MSTKRLYLIDATAFCYRAFYAIRNLSTSFGQPTNAVFGFVNMLNKILKKQNPQYLAVCFDVSRDTFRTKKFAEYKINRPPMPDELSSQIPLIKQIVKAYGIEILEKEGFEADDIIATMVNKAKAKKFPVTIISSDKDILQLVDKDVEVFSPQKDEGTTYDVKLVQERFGVMPSLIPDIIALMGDSIDNIPGIPGIGEKTAMDLISSFGSLDNLLGKYRTLEKEKIRNTIKDNLEKIKLNKELALLDDRMDMRFDEDSLRIKEPDTAELFRIFKQLEFKKLLSDLPHEETKEKEIKTEAVGESDIKEIKESCRELYLFGTNKEDVVLSYKKAFLSIPRITSGLKEVFSRADIKKISHDLKNIKVFLSKENFELSGLYFDTMIAAYLLNPAKPSYALTDIVLDYLDVSLAEDLQSDKALELILKLKPKLEKELEEKNLLGLFNKLEMPLVEVLAEMELTGIKLDLKVLKSLSGDIEKRLTKLINDIYKISGEEFNINSTHQLRIILFEKLKLPVIKKGKTGPSTDEEVLRKLAHKHELPALLLEYRMLMKLKTTYIDTLPELVDSKTGRIHTSFNQTGTETGRLSSSNPNLQNIPIKTDIGKNIRRAIIASSEDNLLLACDYSQIELRILAHLSQDKALIAAFKNDKDIHKATASLIYGIEEKDVDDSMRDTAKRVNFGIIYGLTFYGLSRDLGIRPEQAQQFIDNYFLKYPQVKEYIESQIKRAKKDGFVTTILGRRRYTPEINSKNQMVRQFAERQAVNTPIQGSASDLIKLAMIDIHKEIKKRKLQSRMIMQIHDELVFDVPEKEIKEIAELVKERMENVLKLDIPIRVDIKKGKNWLETEGMK